jgi:hypothetical protein
MALCVQDTIPDVRLGWIKENYGEFNIYGQGYPWLVIVEYEREHTCRHSTVLYLWNQQKC